MHARIAQLRSLEPRNAGLASYRAILEAAAGLFAQLPQDGIALRGIVAAAGVGNQTLYNYFPEGRDDIALVLADRFQRSMLDDLKLAIERVDWNAAHTDDDTANTFGSCLARACFGFMESHRPFLSGLFAYLRDHHLDDLLEADEELQACLAAALTARFGLRIPPEARPRLALQCASLARGQVQLALRETTLSLADLENDTRRLVRTLIRGCLQDPRPSSGGHAFEAYTPPPIAVLPPQWTDERRTGLLDRILKRRKPR